MKAKPILLSSFVVVTFILYSLQQRHEGSGSTIAISTAKPPATSQTSTASGSSGQGVTSTAGSLKDGTYTGSTADAFYGNIQVQAVISSGKLTDVQVLQYPNDQDNSVRINSQALPLLKQEAIQSQSSNVNIITGATDTSQAFVQSLGTALQKAQTG